MNKPQYIKTDFLKVQRIAGARSPCMTIKELSNDKGVPYSTLLRAFKKSDCAPNFTLKRGAVKYYCVKLLLGWFELNYKKSNPKG